MAVNESRSMNEELHAGMTDRTYKKITMDRAGLIDTLTYETRMHLDDIWYGFTESGVKVMPDGRKAF